MTYQKLIVGIVCLAFVVACDGGPKKVEQDDVVNYFRAHKTGDSDDYAVVKRGLGGDAYLAVIFGMVDNRSACEDLIAPYNKDPNLSVLPGEYRCERLN